MKYPRIIAEDRTLQLLHDGHSIARFGDGELRLATGSACTSQRAEPCLAEELRAMLAAPKNCLIGIPNIPATPKKDNWLRYAEQRFTRLYGVKEYASAFITRPDSAPWIDTPAYWAAVRELWRDRDVVLVRGDEKSITPQMLGNSAATWCVVDGPRQHAYAEIGRIEREVLRAARPGRGEWRPLVILCLGAAATCLAYRLAQQKLQALDLGHIGMFMRHAGAYRFQAAELASDDYRKVLRTMHGSTRWGKDGHSHAATVADWARQLGAVSVLDYGCGRGTLKPALPAELRVQEYDPGIVGKDKLPKPVDLLVSTDVLEHIEPDRVDNVLGHMRRLAGKGAFHVIALKPARAILPDGRNAHLTLQPAAWWLQKLAAHGFKIARSEERKGLYVWATV